MRHCFRLFAGCRFALARPSTDSGASAGDASTNACRQSVETPSVGLLPTRLTRTNSDVGAFQVVDEIKQFRPCLTSWNHSVSSDGTPIRHGTAVLPNSSAAISPPNVCVYSRRVSAIELVGSMTFDLVNQTMPSDLNVDFRPSAATFWMQVARVNATAVQAVAHRRHQAVACVVWPVPSGTLTERDTKHLVVMAFV